MLKFPEMNLLTKILLACMVTSVANAQNPAPSFINSLNGWKSTSVFTVGGNINGFKPLGLMDGLGAINLNDSTFRLFINHEASSDMGNRYSLQNGLRLSGARITFFDIDKKNFSVTSGGDAIKEIINAAGKSVSSGLDLGNSLKNDGLHRFCSGKMVSKGSFNLENTLYFAGEERDGGKEFALDVNSGILYELPALGKAGFENITFINTGENEHVALVIGDDRSGSPLLLYVGLKNPNGDFLDKNGLKFGKLFVWVADDNSLTPADFKGTGVSKSGKFISIPYYDATQKGVNGYDSSGYALQSKQDDLASVVSAFRFSRPEDASTNPFNGQQIVFSSTGKGDQFPDDDYGILCVINFNLNTLSAPKATIKIVYDGDDAGNGQFAESDFGLRSPDNNEWLSNGYVVIQEDKSVKTNRFGGKSERETSIWEYHPLTDKLNRIAEINREVKLPPGQNDRKKRVTGAWESSGIIDITKLLNLPPDSIFMLATIQAHGVNGGNIDTDSLIEGGQLVLLTGVRKEQLYCNPPPSNTINLSLCIGDSIKINGVYRKENGQFQETRKNTNGCDTLSVINLKFSKCISGIIENHKYFSIYPNPAVNEVYISVNNISNNSEIEIKAYTVTGKLTYSRKVRSDGGFLLYKINTKRWKSGVYKLILNSEINQMIATIIINK